MKPQLLATTKSNNYLLNVLLHMENVDKGGEQGIWLDDNGTITKIFVNYKFVILIYKIYQKIIINFKFILFT